MTMQTVIGASPAPKLLICWGTLSSRMRKWPRGMLGMNRPLLSRTATSTFTTLVSTLKSGCSEASSLSLRLSLDGILGCSASAGSPFLRGRATVSPTSFFGPSCPGSRKPRAARAATGRKAKIRMGRNSTLTISNRRPLKSDRSWWTSINSPTYPDPTYASADTPGTVSSRGAVSRRYTPAGNTPGRYGKMASAGTRNQTPFRRGARYC